MYSSALRFTFSCYFDGVKGTVANLFFTTVPLLVVFSMNTVLYTFTWVRIKDHDRKIKRFKGTKEYSASKQAARSFLLFVVAFFIQWWASFVFGLWSLFAEEVPQLLFNGMVIFANLGGVFNLIVYVIMRRRGLRTRDRSSLSDRLNNRQLRENSPKNIKVSTLTGHGRYNSQRQP